MNGGVDLTGRHRSVCEKSDRASRPDTDRLYFSHYLPIIDSNSHLRLQDGFIEEQLCVDCKVSRIDWP